MFGLGSPNKLGDRAHFIDVPYLLDSDVNIQTILPNGTLLIIFMECLEKVTVVKLVCQRDVYMAHPRSPPGRDPPGRPVRAPPRHGCLHRHHGPGHRLGRLDAATVVTTGSRFFSSTAGLVPRPVHTAVVISTAARAIYATVVVTIARAGSLTVSSLLVPPPPSRDTSS